MIKYINAFCRKLIGVRDDDPVYNCDVYKKEGCSHVDGYLCDMKTCSILKDHKEEIKNARI